MSLPATLTDRARTIADALTAIDERTGAFAVASGVRCPEGCGRCCHSPHVEATVAELLPMAEQIIGAGLGGTLLEQLDGRPGDRRCILFEEDPADPARGRCSMYAWRPAMCRLFGFAGRRDADGHPQFTACRVHTEVAPEAVSAARLAVASGSLPLPIFSDLASGVAAADPGRSGPPRPINDALREAIHAAGLTLRLSELRDACADDEDNDGDGAKPTTPRRPTRRAA